MTESKYTPGPWTAEGSEQTTSTWVNGPDRKRVCSIRPCDAPDLLAALNRIADMKTVDGNAIEMHREELRAIARIAIAKAKGQ